MSQMRQSIENSEIDDREGMGAVVCLVFACMLLAAILFGLTAMKRLERTDESPFRTAEESASALPTAG